MLPKAPALDFSPPGPSERGTCLFRALLCAGALLLTLVASTACMPPTPAQKATDAAREMNMAARWGRMTEAVDMAAPEERAKFSARRSTWHGNVRIVETELVGLDMKDAMHAVVEVDVSWMFSDDPTLRLTRLKQEWEETAGKWRMKKEKKLSGDPGLFGEKVKKDEKKKDKHFPSRVIH